MPPNARDTLYQNLPPNIKFSLRSKILSFHVKEQVPSHFTNALITKHQFCTSNGQDKFKLELKELADFMLGSFKLNFVSILCPLLFVLATCYVFSIYWSSARCYVSYFRSSSYSFFSSICSSVLLKLKLKWRRHYNG